MSAVFSIGDLLFIHIGIGDIPKRMLVGLSSCPTEDCHTSSSSNAIMNFETSDVNIISCSIFLLFLCNIHVLLSITFIYFAVALSCSFLCGIFFRSSSICVCRSFTSCSLFKRLSLAIVLFSSLSLRL
jgi:hypothetical protein